MLPFVSGVDLRRKRGWMVCKLQDTDWVGTGGFDWVECVHFLFFFFLVSGGLA